MLCLETCKKTVAQKKLRTAQFCTSQMQFSLGLFTNIYWAVLMLILMALENIKGLKILFKFSRHFRRVNCLENSSLYSNNSKITFLFIFSRGRVWRRRRNRRRRWLRRRHGRTRTYKCQKPIFYIWTAIKSEKETSSSLQTIRLTPDLCATNETPKCQNVSTNFPFHSNSLYYWKMHWICYSLPLLR